MNGLRGFAVLQARVYEFLEQLDEATLQAIASGAVRLAVHRTDGAQVPAGSPPGEGVHRAPRTEETPGLAVAPSSDPLQAAHDLSRLPSEQERRVYLNAAGLRVPELRKLAKALGLVHYSRLDRAGLMDRLVGHVPEQVSAPRISTPPPDHDNGESERRASTEGARATTGSSPSNDDAAAIAAHLRETETEDEGAAYLEAQHLDRKGLLAVAAQLQLTRVERLSQKELRRRVLKQAIGARRKFAGLRKW